MKFEIPSDLKRWYAISCPRTGLRFDSRTLEFLDSDGDGRIRSEELSAALELVKTAGYAVESLFEPDESLAAALADNLARQDDLGKVEPTDEERQALADWEAKGKELERKYNEAEKVYVYGIFQTANLTPEQLAELIRSKGTVLPQIPGGYATENYDSETYEKEDPEE